MYVKLPHLPAKIAQAFRPVYVLFENKYYLDALYFNVFAKGTRALGNFFWKVGDTAIIDNGIVNGSAKTGRRDCRSGTQAQTGFIYTYAAAMVFGVIGLARHDLLGLVQIKAGFRRPVHRWSRGRLKTNIQVIGRILVSDMKKKIVQSVGFENPTKAYRDCSGKDEIFRRRLGRLKKET